VRALSPFLGVHLIQILTIPPDACKTIAHAWLTRSLPILIGQPPTKRRPHRQRPGDGRRGRPGQGLVPQRAAALHAGTGRRSGARAGLGQGRRRTRVLQRRRRRRQAPAGGRRRSCDGGCGFSRWRWGRCRRWWRRREGDRGRGVESARRGGAGAGLERHQRADRDGRRGLQVQGGSGAVSSFFAPASASVCSQVQAPPLIESMPSSRAATPPPCIGVGRVWPAPVPERPL
jgi:hypothetical protein